MMQSLLVGLKLLIGIPDVLFDYRLVANTQVAEQIIFHFFLALGIN